MRMQFLLRRKEQKSKCEGGKKRCFYKKTSDRVLERSKRQEEVKIK